VVKVFILDSHSIYRRGLAACLESVEDVRVIGEAATVDDALQDSVLVDADLLLLDHDLVGGWEFLRQAHSALRCAVVVCSGRSEESDVLAAIQAGAVGYLCKDTLTPDVLAAGMRAAAGGAGVMTPEVLGSLLRSINRISEDLLEPRGLSLSRLTEREQQVLSLVAEGHPTREVADRLCYSERTIKNVLHDVVMKMNARTRSQAVAQAVREGLI